MPDLQQKLYTGHPAFSGHALFYHYPYHNGVLEVTGDLFAEPLHCLPLHMRRDVRVGVQREGDPRMTQDFLQNLRVFAKFEPESGESVPEIVRPDIRQIRLIVPSPLAAFSSPSLEPALLTAGDGPFAVAVSTHRFLPFCAYLRF